MNPPVLFGCLADACFDVTVDERRVCFIGVRRKSLIRQKYFDLVTAILESIVAHKDDFGLSDPSDSVGGCKGCGGIAKERNEDRIVRAIILV